MKTITVSLKNMQHSGMTLDEYLDDIAGMLIEHALEHCADNKQQAGILLGINRTTLLYRIGQYERLKHKINPARPRSPVQ